jgi:hypothetical protein
VSGNPDIVDHDDWQDGQRAWRRIRAWSGENKQQLSGEYDAIAALSDLRLVRALLEEVEREAVLGARQLGRSWASVASMLGVTRQSAWERWRDVVEGSGPP